MAPPTDLRDLSPTAPPVASDREDPRIFLKDRAYELLKTMILKETFAPGSFLSERTLAENARNEQNAGALGGRAPRE